jgi:alkylation response protein AidB-like acyl-CoA dehydrogenase
VAIEDVVGPDTGVGEWRLSAAAEEVLGAIADRAAESDAHGISRDEIDALASVGLLGTALEPVARQREVAERIAMADASVWFCWAQHQTPLKTLASAEPGDHAPLVDEIKSRWLAGLSDGSFLGSVAFAHLRRPGTPNPVAERVHGGWSISGTLDWVTSWDIADVMLLMVRGSGDYVNSIICAYLAAGRDPAYLEGLHVHEPLKLLAMSGTHTRPMTLDAVEIPDTNVVALMNFDDWSRADATKTVDVNPATFGVIRGVLGDLATTAERRGDEQMRVLSASLAERTRRLRRAAYGAMDDGGDADQRVELRAHALRLAVEATTAVITAQAGASMRTGCSAERRLREAMFLQVQAQTARTRAASLALLGTAD